MSLLDFTGLFSKEERVWPGRIGSFPVGAQSQQALSQPCGRELSRSEPGDFP